MEETVDFDALLDDSNDGTMEDNTFSPDDFDGVNVNDLLGEPHVENNEPTLKEEPTGESTEEDTTEPQQYDDPLYAFMQSRGITDPGKIQISNEDGTTEEVDFSSLSKDEQMEILNELSDPGLTEDEINTVNFLRKNGLDFRTAMDSYAKSYLDQYLKANPDQVKQKTYDIDDYSDDDIYIVDLKRRFPNFTDEEILAKLDNAKENEELYRKETEILRNSYKEQEDKAEQDRVLAEQQAAEDLRNNLINAAKAFNEVQLDYTDANSDSLVIEDSDKQKMVSYILDKDANGKSQLVKDLENPDALIELAWLRTQGAEVLSNITQYWKGILSNERAENKKLRSQLEKVNKKNDSTVIVPRDKKPAKGASINDLWGNSI